MRRMYEEEAVAVRIAKVNSRTSPMNTNGTNGVLSFVYKAIRVAVETDRLGSSDSD